MTTIRVVGRVIGLYRFPVKSMAGEMVSTARLWWHGLEGDRRYAFVKANSNSSFPWLTARDFPGMLQYRPAFTDPDNPAQAQVKVRTPSGAVLPIDSSELRSELEQRSKESAYLLHLGRGAVDSMPVSLLSRNSVLSLSAETGVELEPHRFRANIVVESADGLPYAEEAWLGQQLVFGERPDSARVQMLRKDRRCMIVNLDPETAAQEPRVLRSIASTRGECFGIYGSVIQPGSVAVGDPIHLIT